MQKKGKRRVHKRGVRHRKRVDSRLDTPVPSKIIFAVLASIILLLGLFAIKNYTPISVGKAYEIVFRGEEFTENVEIGLLADRPEKLLLTVGSVAKNANFELIGSGSELTINIEDDIIFTSTGRLTDQIFVIDTFDGVTEKTFSTPDSIFLKIPKGANVLGASIKVEEEEEAEEEIAAEEETVSEDKTIEEDVGGNESDETGQESESGAEEDVVIGGEIIVEQETTEEHNETEEGTISEDEATGENITVDRPKEETAEDEEQEDSEEESIGPIVKISGQEISLGTVDISQLITTECEDNICTSELEFTSDVNHSLLLSELKIEYKTKVKNFSAEINEQCSEYPCEVLIYITSETDGVLTLSNINIEVEEVVGKEVEELEEPTCETSLDCPIYQKCEEGVCTGFCEDITSEQLSESGSGDSKGSQKTTGSQTTVSKLNELGYDVFGKTDISDYEIQKYGNFIRFSSDSEIHVFDQQLDSFIFSDEEGNKMHVQKQKGKRDSQKPKASHIVEFNEKPLLVVKSELEKQLGVKTAEIKIQQSIKERVEARLNNHKQRLKEAKESALEEMKEVNPDIESKIRNSYKNTFNGVSLDISEEAALELKSLPSVKDVYRNEEVYPLLEESVNQISADEVWKLLDDQEIPVTGDGVTIGIIDTGVDYTHEDLGGCLGEECKVTGGYDFVNNDNDPMDDHGHGTHVAATAAGNGILKGVAPNANIVAYKVLSAGGSGSWNMVIESIERAVDPNQDGDFSDHLDIISLSLGGPGNPDDPISQAIDNAVDAGVVAVIAAGNSGPGQKTIGSPGTARKAITVGAVDKCDLIASFSSRGHISWDNGILLKPDLTAPGVAICAAQWDDAWANSECIDNEHTAISGTSMATPHVSGAAALLLQVHPEWAPEMIKSVLMSTSLDLGLKLTDQGAGRMDILGAYNAKITTLPSSISFEFDAVESSHTEIVSIKNLVEEEIIVNLEILELKDENGNVYDFASLSTNELTISGNSVESFDFIVDMPEDIGGLFTGKIVVSSDDNEYVIPFILGKFSKLTLKATGADEKMRPSFTIHNDDLSYKISVWNGWDFVGDSFTVKLPSGTYTAYAMGEFESDLEYILMDRVEVLPYSDTKLELSLANARPFTVKAESLQGTPLEIHQWSKEFVTYNDKKAISSNPYDPTLGDQVIYISDKPDNGLDTDLLLWLQGVPTREESDSTSHVSESKTYKTAEEQYDLGWLLHNVDENTPTNLDYSEEDFAVYNYSFNFPSTQPQFFYNVFNWMRPIHKNSGGGQGASLIRLSVPLDRVYYIKGENPVPEQYRTEWSFSNYVWLNYLKSYDSLAQFGFDIAHTEHYYAITPIPGDKKHIYFGKAPFTPTSFIINNNVIKLNGHLIRGYNDYSYLIRPKKISVMEFSLGDVRELDLELPTPKYQIYLDGELKEEMELIKDNIFDYSVLNYAIEEYGNYIVDLTIPINYPVWNNTIIKALFTVPANELQPPEFQHMEMNPYFMVGEEQQIQVDLHDESGIETVEIYILENEEWALLETEVIDAENYVYSASYTPPAGTEKIDLRIIATDTIGNSVSYTILPVALPAQSITFNLESENEVISKGDLARIDGECRINDEELCNNFLINHYINDEFFENDNTDVDGKFNSEWQVPFDYDSGKIKFAAKYRGTGVYLPYEETITVSTEFFDIDVGVFDLKIGEAIMREPVKVTGVVGNLGSDDASDVLVEFRVNGNLLEEKLIPEVKVGESKPVEFEWLPGYEGYYDIKLTAVSEDDQHPDNDFVYEFTRINFIAPDMSIYVPKLKTAIIDTETNVEFEISNWGEEKAENVKAYLYDLYEPEGFYLSFYGEEVPVEEVPEEEGEKIGAKEKKKVSGPREVTYDGIKYTFVAYYDGSVALDVSTEEFDETLNFAFDDKIKKLQNGVYVYMDFFSSWGVDFKIGSAAVAEKELDDLDVYEQRIEAMEWTPKIAGKYSLLLFVNTSKDSDFNNNYFDERVKVSRTGVNIEAELFIDYTTKFIVGTETNITAEIKNLGTEDAKNIKVSLYQEKQEEEETWEVESIKKKQIGTSKIDILPEKEGLEINFSWTPENSGYNYLTLLAETKKDIEPENNDVLRFVYVTSDKADVSSGLFYPNMDIFVNEEAEIEGFVRNSGQIEAQSVSAVLYEIKDETRKLIENKSIGTLEVSEEFDVKYKWTPTSSGETYLELVVEAANDRKSDNNVDSIRITVLVKDFDVKPTIISYPEFIIVNEKAHVTISLQNFGKEDAPEFNLFLKVNGTVMDGADYESLSSSSWGRYVHLSWFPTEDGIYLLEAVVDSTDSNPSNNIDKDIVEVYKTKDVEISLVDKDGLFVERSLLVGNYEGIIDETVSLTIPDAPLEIWIAKEESDGIAASFYFNSSIGDKLTISSSHIRELSLQDGLLLYEIFANNDSWNYDSLSNILHRELETLNIRYTELKSFVCDNEYDFSIDACGEWKELPSDTLIDRGQFLLTANALKAQAFAIGDDDYDGDNAPDWDDDDSDNDGIADSDDTFTCINGRIKSREIFNVTINDSEDIGKELKGKNKVGIRDKDKKIVEFNVNLDEDSIDCREIIVEKQPEVTTRGYTLITGVSLTDETKTVFVDKIAAFNRVCVKDEEIESIDEVTQNCDGSNEYLVICDGSKQGNYNCTEVEGRYKVEGLIHSAVVEPTTCEESWTCTDWGGCVDGKEVRTCTDANGCGTNFNKPSGEQSCETSSEEGERSSSRSGSSSRKSIYDFGEIKDWSGGKTQSAKVKNNDLIIFTYNDKLNNIVLSWIKGTSVSISMSFKSGFITFKRGETKNFDIDHDGKDDIAVTVESVTLNRATLLLERINSDVGPSKAEKKEASSKTDSAPPPKLSQTPKTSEEVEEETDKTGTVTSKKSGFFYAMISFGIVLIIIAAVLGIVYYRTRHPEEKKTGDMEKTRAGAAPQNTEFRKLESYILTELNKGFTFKEVHNALKKAGWNEETVKSVMDDIRVRNSSNRKRNM
tara:strand:- start:14755 stop:23715 length:8961 start_codon:yes stop_codon:yes gene_type:complete